MPCELTCSGKTFDLLLVFNFYVIWPHWNTTTTYIVRSHNMLRREKKTTERFFVIEVLEMCIGLCTATTWYTDTKSSFLFKKQTNITILNVYKGRELVIITYSKAFGKNWHWQTNWLEALYLGHCIGGSDSSRANYIMGYFPLSPEKLPMLLTVEGCWGTAASDTVDLPEETIESWGK